jgi:hypothetical protein
MDHLSVYEFEQIHAIATWKSERPSLLGSVVGGLFGPLKPWVARAVRRSVIEDAVAELATVGAIDDGMAEVARRAKISDVRELRFSPMRECDSLASRVTMTAQRDQLIQAFVRQTSNSELPWSFPLPLVMALRFICRVGHCYGYALDSATDRKFVIHVLGWSAAQEHNSASQASVEPASDGLNDLGRVGAASSVSVAVESKAVARRSRSPLPERLILDHAFLNRVDAITRRAFQERWLVDNGKADAIAPSVPRRRSSLDDMNRAVSQMAYIVGGAIGFGAVFPMVVMCELLTRGDHAGARGIRDGARSAVKDADEFLAGLLGREPPPTELRRSQAFRPILP